MMPKEHFSQERATALKDVSQGGTVHVIGVCGVAMAQIAVELTKRGYRVSGSDREYYEPMKGVLRQSAVHTFEGFAAEQVPDDASLVVIGNAIRYENPEVLHVERAGLRYTFFPKLLGELVIGDNRSCVITGTHGKTTSSALAASILVSSNRAPSLFVGGVAKGLPQSLQGGDGGYSVVEGDEYDSAFFAKVPKFEFYRADALLVTSIEYDHADIYKDLRSIERAFTNNVFRVAPSGVVVACIDCSTVRGLIPEWRSAAAPVITYGVHGEADFRIVERTFRDGIQTITVQEKGRTFTFSVPLLGAHNARNSLGVFLSLRALGISEQELQEGMRAFQGVRRRQDIRAQRAGIIVMEDFAHHPTAVRETLTAIREGYPDRRLIVAFEPRSNTSRRKVFEKQYCEAFDSADVIYLSTVEARAGDEQVELIDIRTLGTHIASRGKIAFVEAGAEAIARTIVNLWKPGDLVVVMSNGSFGGLIDTLCSALPA